MGWFFRILIGIFWVGWFYFWIWDKDRYGEYPPLNKNGR
ncbi:hypothetical protein [uncultured Gammaproteobacteria bacterium]|nr:hypothetical protein [uncultured Gammaproteobacteria bacterium]CAC9653631.1 hypothetical protein [uncultured Gammaproteobacteria bacterium]